MISQIEVSMKNIVNIVILVEPYLYMYHNKINKRVYD